MIETVGLLTSTSIEGLGATIDTDGYVITIDSSPCCTTIGMVAFEWPDRTATRPDDEPLVTLTVRLGGRARTRTIAELGATFMTTVLAAVGTPPRARAFPDVTVAVQLTATAGPIPRALTTAEPAVIEIAPTAAWRTPPRDRTIADVGVVVTLTVAAPVGTPPRARTFAPGAVTETLMVADAVGAAPRARIFVGGAVIETGDAVETEGTPPRARTFPDVGAVETVTVNVVECAPARAFADGEVTEAAAEATGMRQRARVIADGGVIETFVVALATGTPPRALVCPVVGAVAALEAVAGLPERALTSAAGGVEDAFVPPVAARISTATDVYDVFAENVPEIGAVVPGPAVTAL